MNTPKHASELFAELRSLDLPADHYAVFGSGPLGIRGLHVINDVDVIVTASLFAELEARYGSEDHEHGIRRIMLFGDDIEILNGWYPPIAPIEQLIAEAETIDGIRFVTLERVLEWKQKRGKPKDTAHIALIAQYLAEQGRSGSGGSG